MDAEARDGDAAPEAEQRKHAVKAVEVAADTMQDIDTDPLATNPSVEESDVDAVALEPGSSPPVAEALDTAEPAGQAPDEAGHLPDEEAPVVLDASVGGTEPSKTVPEAEPVPTEPVPTKTSATEPVPGAEDDSEKVAQQATSEPMLVAEPTPEPVPAPEPAHEPAPEPAPAPEPPERLAPTPASPAPAPPDPAPAPLPEQTPAPLPEPLASAPEPPAPAPAESDAGTSSAALKAPRPVPVMGGAPGTSQGATTSGTSGHGGPTLGGLNGAAPQPTFGDPSYRDIQVVPSEHSLSLIHI